MKNIKITISALIFTLALLTSCSEEVEIKEEFESQYVLNCILSHDTSYQVAYLSKSFDIEGYDIDSYTENPFVSGATITIYEDGDIYLFQEAQIDSLIGFNTGYPITYYYLDNYKPLSNRNIMISANMPDGKRLTANLVAISHTLSYLPIFRRAIPPVDTTEKEIEFRVYDQFKGDYFVPKLELTYEYPISSGNFFFTEVPVNYVESNGALKPVYPDVYRLIDFSYDRDVLGIAMRKISGNDPFKQNYRVVQAKLSLLVLNDDLAAFYSAENFINDNYSISVSQPEFSNIEGGRGIFGSYSKVAGNIQLNRDYVLSFGYRY